MFSRYWAISVFGSRFDLSVSRDVIDHIRFLIGHFLVRVLLERSLYGHRRRNRVGRVGQVLHGF